MIGVGGELAVIPFDSTQITHPDNRSRCEPGSPSPTLAAHAQAPTIAFAPVAPTLTTGRMHRDSGQDDALGVSTFNVYPTSGQGTDLEASPTDLAASINVTALAASTDRGTRIVDGGVRRLTPTECERLQGFPDGFTALEGASDTARYAALGNSIAVPCLRWIFERIASVA